MVQEDLDFSFDFEGYDRENLLGEAAARLDRLHSTHLGEGDAGDESAPSEHGNFARELISEDARLPAMPDVYKITDKDYLSRNLNAPVRFTQLSKDYNFYWIYFPVGLLPSHNWDFNKIEVKIEFNPGETQAHLRPKAYQILPHKKYQTLIKANQSLSLQFDENFELNAQTGKIAGGAGPMKGELDLGVGGVAKGGFGAVLGPFEYHIKRAKIEHNAERMEWVFWRLDGVEFTQEDAAELVVVAQIPKETKEVTIEAKLLAYHRFNFAAAGFQSAVANLPKVMRDVFKGGVPLPDSKMWDITPRL